MSKIAVLTICFNEEEVIGACIRNWKDVADKHLVLISSETWNGLRWDIDKTEEIARGLGAEVVKGEWKSEAEQRTWGLARLYDWDYVLIVDPDEFYTKEDQNKILVQLSNPIDPSYRPDVQLPAFRAQNVMTYWKTPEFAFDPPDRHKPVIAVDPKQLYSHEHRSFKFMGDSRKYLDYMPFIDVTMHHFSYVKSDAKIKEKITSFSHSESVRPDWYVNVWQKWTEGSDMMVRSYGQEQSVAIHKPAPLEIVELFK